MNFHAKPSFSAKVLEFIDQVTYRPAYTADDKEAIFRLRYNCYLREGAIAPNSQKILRDGFDDLPNVWIFGLYVQNELASTMRIHVASNLHRQSPAMDVFSDILTPYLNSGRTVSDPTRFAADPVLSREFPYLSYATVRLPWLACEYFGIDLGLATVRTEHAAFYRRLFSVQEMGEPRTYPGLRKPITMMGADYRAVRDKVVDRYPFMTASAVQLESLFGRHAWEGETDIVPLRQRTPAHIDQPIDIPFNPQALAGRRRD
ncbi:MAG: N-acyl amino acid synthase FeeM domain-containing protein, partial [Beijerinckiaceae bacterium]